MSGLSGSSSSTVTFRIQNQVRHKNEVTQSHPFFTGSGSGSGAGGGDYRAAVFNKSSPSESKFSIIDENVCVSCGKELQLQNSMNFAENDEIDRFSCNNGSSSETIILASSPDDHEVNEVKFETTETNPSPAATVIIEKTDSISSSSTHRPNNYCKNSDESTTDKASSSSSSEAILSRSRCQSQDSALNYNKSNLIPIQIKHSVSAPVPIQTNFKGFDTDELETETRFLGNEEDLMAIAESKFVIDATSTSTSTSTPMQTVSTGNIIMNKLHHQFHELAENIDENQTQKSYTINEWNWENAVGNMKDISEMYMEKLDWIDENIKMECGSSLSSNAKAQINVLKLWVADLKEQNEALVEIVADIDVTSQREISKLKTKLMELSQRYQVQGASIKTFQSEVVRLRLKALQLEEENELIKKSTLAWETSNQIVRQKLKQSDDEIEKLLLLLCRIRDCSKWDLTNIHFSPEIQFHLFANHPHLPNSPALPTTFNGDPSCHLSTSQSSFLFQEKCAELEAVKEELEKFSTQNSSKERVYQEKLKTFEHLESKLLEANIQLKQYHNKLEEVKGKIRVYCRIKPGNTPSSSSTALSTGTGKTLPLFAVTGTNDASSAPHIGLGPVSTAAFPSTSPHSVVKFLDDFTVGVEMVRERDKGLKEFQFDRIFHENNSQEDIFDETKSLIQSAFDGFNVCIAAYGQTGTGKTFTILGDDRDPGITPRTCNQLFSIASRSKHLFITSISVYAIELYNQKLIDLLATTSTATSGADSSAAAASGVGAGAGAGEGVHGHSLGSSSANGNPSLFQNPNVDDSSNHGNGNTGPGMMKLLGCSGTPDGDKLEIRKDGSGTVFIQGAKVIPVEDSSTLLRLLQSALQSRHTSQTQMNDYSSRSHLIIGINIENTCRLNGNVTRGKISLMDLAGSERQRKMSSSTSALLQESTNINKSLSALEHVIVSLTSEQGHVPYRNNKLTEILQDSIGGNAKTLFFINVSPLKSNLDETIVSLNYGARIKNVVNNAVKNHNNNYYCNSQSDPKNSANASGSGVDTQSPVQKQRANVGNSNSKSR